MTATQLASIEQRLSVRLPAEFGTVLAEHGQRLQDATYELGWSKKAKYFVDQIFLAPDQFVRVNMAERSVEATGRLYPGWEKSFVLVGSNGAGDFYALRLDETPGVWLIGTRCGDTPTRTQESLSGYVDWLYGQKPSRVNEWDIPPTPSATEQAFLSHIIADPADTLRRLVFADWLEENGQGPRAAYIRARCTIDDGPPEFGSYVDALEQVKTCGYTPPRASVPPGFSFDVDNSDLLVLFGGSHDGMECGLPSLAEVEPEAVDEADSARLAGLRLADLVETTSIRGLKPGRDLPNYAGTLFASPAAKKLTRLSIEWETDGDAVCPTVAALVGSPVARNLVRLGLRNNGMGGATAAALAGAAFDRLRVFEDSGHSRDPSAYHLLRAAPWFGRLERLMMPLPAGDFAPLAFPNLHTLGLMFNTNAPLEQFVENAELPAVRRLLIRGGLLDGKRAECLAGLRCGELVELRILGTGIRSAHLKVILAAPWARRLKIFRIGDNGSLAALNKVVDKSPCGLTLRVRQVGSPPR